MVKTAQDMLKEEWEAFQPGGSDSHDYITETTPETTTSTKGTSEHIYNSTVMEPQVQYGNTHSVTSTIITLPTNPLLSTPTAPHWLDALASWQGSL